MAECPARKICPFLSMYNMQQLLNLKENSLQKVVTVKEYNKNIVLILMVFILTYHMKIGPNQAVLNF